MADIYLQFIQKCKVNLSIQLVIREMTLHIMEVSKEILWCPTLKIFRFKFTNLSCMHSSESVHKIAYMYVCTTFEFDFCKYLNMITFNAGMKCFD